MKFWELIGITEEQYNCKHDLHPTDKTHWNRVDLSIEIEYPVLVCSKCSRRILNTEKPLNERPYQTEVNVYTADEFRKLLDSKKEDHN